MDVVAGGHDDGDAARANGRVAPRSDATSSARREPPNSARVGAPGGGAGPPGRIPHQVSRRRTAAWVCARGSMKSSAGKGATWEKRRRYARASAADPGGAMKTRRTCAAQTSASTSRNALAWRSAATDPSARVQTTIVALYPCCDPTTSPKSTRRCVSSASSNEPSPPAAASERGISSDVSRPGQSMLWSYAPVSSSRVGRPAGAPHRKDIARRRRRRRASPRARTCASRHVT